MYIYIYIYIYIYLYICTKILSLFQYMCPKTGKNCQILKVRISSKQVRNTPNRRYDQKLLFAVYIFLFR